MNSPTKGYKATYNYKCREQHFEIGKVYELEGEPIMCVNGFHFCNNMEDVLKYYPYEPNEFKLLEIEAVGKIVKEDDKLCTNKIKILREVPMEEWGFYKMLSNGHCEIHYRDFDGSEYWNEYNEKGRIVHHKKSNGYECWMEYNEKGNEVYYKDSDGVEEWKEYDENGRVIRYKNLINGIDRGKYLKDFDGYEYRDYIKPSHYTPMSAPTKGYKAIIKQINHDNEI